MKKSITTCVDICDNCKTEPSAYCCMNCGTTRCLTCNHVDFIVKTLPLAWRHVSLRICTACLGSKSSTKRLNYLRLLNNTYATFQANAERREEMVRNELELSNQILKASITNLKTLSGYKPKPKVKLS